MNKVTQLFFLVLFPFLPFLAWMVSLVRDTQIEMFLTLMLIPFALYVIISPKVNFPKYLTFFFLFTIYHLVSVFVYKLVPSDTTTFKFLLADRFVLASLFFFVVENTDFDERFIRIMNRNIFLIIIISVVFSLIQLKNSSFFVAPMVSENLDNETFLTENRVFSIYSWVNLNTLGISFPILIAILLSFLSTRNLYTAFLFLSGIIVSFLSKARYVMLSVIIVFSQLLFIAKIKFGKKVAFFFIFIVTIIISVVVANVMGYNIQEVINDRILEKSTNMGSASSRILSFFVFLRVFPENPLFGVGPHTSVEVVRLLAGRAPIIHVGFLSYLYFYGIFGASMLFISLFYMLKKAWRIGSKYQFWAGFFGLLAFCFANTTMVYFNFSEMGIILIFIYLRYFSQTESMELVED